ncbi:sodium bile acid symporter family protein [Rossellomorea aquimaris]|uniref:Sodium bile acid symporter family protein n=1 Tax=Rossellomorea aquimaris TaxID=189382 RepID=A0A366ELS3_9BACI|nr:sodium bile acid symporter family protein [Rossellomorea aquimaris]
MKLLETISNLAGKYFAIWVIFVAAVAYFVPAPFLPLGGYITILLGVVMFGMGLTLKPVDFQLVLKKPLPVITGVLAQFIIMPLGALLIAYILNLPNELAAGLVLLGSVPGGTSSNVMVYLAKGNLALSVAMTSLSTLLAPIATDFASISGPMASCRSNRHVSFHRSSDHRTHHSWVSHSKTIPGHSGKESKCHSVNISIGHHHHCIGGCFSKC